jgi:hypothetical protein
MGWYINPRSSTKEDWLAEHGTPTRGPTEITETHLPVCLVNNGYFTAAVICPDERELIEFGRDDNRPKVWFSVPRQTLIEHHFFQE